MAKTAFFKAILKFCTTNKIFVLQTTNKKQIQILVAWRLPGRKTINYKSGSRKKQRQQQQEILDERRTRKQTKLKGERKNE